MKKPAMLLLFASLFSGACAGNSTFEEPVLSLGATGSGSGSLLGWASLCPACLAATR
jgi:hypothetical protein